MERMPKIDLQASAADAVQNNVPSKPSPSVSCSILTTETEVAAIADEWRNLQDLAGVIPYTSYDWFDTWWQHLGKPMGETLHIVTARQGHRLVAVLPLAIHHKRGLRILRYIGVVVAYVCDCLTESPSFVDPVIKAARSSDLFDYAVFSDVNPNTACERALAEFSVLCGIENFYFLVNQWENSDAWFTSLSRNNRKNYRQRLKRLEERGDVRVVASPPGAPPRADIIDNMLKEKKLWVTKRNKHGFFDLSGSIEFIRSLASKAAQDRQLDLIWLECDNHVIASILSFSYRSVAYGFMISNDPAWKAYSPGIHLMDQYFCAAINTGLKEVNLLKHATPAKLKASNSIRNYPEWGFAANAAGRIGLTSYRLKRALHQQAYRLWKQIEQRKGSNPALAKVYSVALATRGFLSGKNQPPNDEPGQQNAA